MVLYRNLEDLLRIVFIREECGNLKGFLDDRELTKNINEKKKSGVLQACRCPVSDNCFRREYSNKHVEYCESVE